MCGIIGILGRAPVADQMVDALKRLEYRGYDSAGVATLEQGHLTRRRAEGKLKNLEQRLTRAPLGGTIGIGVCSPWPLLCRAFSISLNAETPTRHRRLTAKQDGA